MAIVIGIIGFGFMGYEHLKNISQVDGFQIAGIHDNGPSRLEFAREMGQNTYDTMESLLADPAVNTILVATPNQFHKEQSIAALRAGKHVICEKPAMMNAAELEEVLQVARETGRLFTVHQNRRQDPDYRIVARVLEERTIGEPVFIESRVQGANGIPSDWRRQAECGGGMLLDWGVHLLDQILLLVEGPVTQVTAQLRNVHYPVDDNLKILLQFASGVSTQIDVMTICFQPLPRWHIVGDKGTLNVEGWDCKGSIICGSVDEIDWSLDALKHAAGSTRTMRPRPKASVQTYPLPEAPADKLDYYRNFRAAVEEGAALWVTPEQALRLLKLVDLCFESSRTGTCLPCHL